MGPIIRLSNVNNYSENKTGWPIYSLFSDPMPILKFRNDHDYDENKFRHSTFSWQKGSPLDRAVSIACDVLEGWKALRTSAAGQAKKTKRILIQSLPQIVLSFQKDMDELNRLGVQRISDVMPSDSFYPSLLQKMCQAVEQVSRCKGVDNPMLGSKAMHFFFPEFFPVWDTEWIQSKCLPSEELHLPEEVACTISSNAGRDYGRYVDLMVRELCRALDYHAVEDACLYRAADISREVIEWHYDDVSTIVFEICLIGKNCTD